MRSLIVYYSLEGNTDYAAKLIAEELGADLLCLVPVKAYPTGKVSKFIWGGKAAVMSDTPKLQPYKYDDAAYDLYPKQRSERQKVCGICLPDRFGR